MKNARLVVAAALGFAAFTFTGCGKQQEGSGDAAAKSGGGAATTAESKAGGQSGGAAEGSAAVAPTAASGRAIEITGNDAMKFSVTEIRAKPGESLSVTLVNMGTMPKLSMGHNWVLLKQNVAVDKFVLEAANATTTDYIPQGMRNDIIAHTKLLGPKQSDTVTFQAPKEPGRYVFLCSFPGHFQVGMKGELIVE